MQYDILPLSISALSPALFTVSSGGHVVYFNPIVFDFHAKVIGWHCCFNWPSSKYVLVCPALFLGS